MATNNPYNKSFKDFHARKRAETRVNRLRIQKEKEKRQNERQQRKNDLKEATDNVKNNTEQPKGLAKFTPILLEKGSHIATTMAPVLLDLANQMFQEAQNEAQNQALDAVGNFCPSPEVSLNVLNQLNNTIDDLNQISDFITKITGFTDNIGRYATITQQVSTALKVTIPIVSTAAKAVPLIPGIIVSALDDLDWINNNLLYNNDGSPRLPKVIAGVGGITASASIVSLTINKVVTIIESITEKLEPCLNGIELNEVEDLKIKSLSSETKALSELGNNNFEEQDPVTYNGFIIEIETVPFTPTVNRYQAVGYNTYGIPMIKGELSFSSNALILTNELKFIIDRDNLKAY